MTHAPPTRPGPSAQAPAADPPKEPGDGGQPTLRARLRRDPRFLFGALTIAAFAAMAAAPDLFSGQDLDACSLDRSLDGPSAGHWFGFDVQGCDYYTQAVHGARASMVVGPFVAVAVELS